MDLKEVVYSCFNKGILLSPDFFEELSSNFEANSFVSKLLSKSEESPLVINKDILTICLNTNQNFDLSWLEFDRARVSFEKNQSKKKYDSFLEMLNFKTPEITQQKPEVKLLTPKMVEIPDDATVLTRQYEENVKKREVKDFVSYFKQRYESLKKILLSRQELKSCISISRVSTRQQNELVSIIGMVNEKSITKNGNIIFTLEDPTGKIKVLVNKNKEDFFAEAEEVMLDEVIGIVGGMGKNIIFCNTLLFPEIPVTHELKKSPDEVYAAFISDVHFGIKNFYKKDFKNFLSWLNLEYGTEQQKEVASKIKYLFIAGDVIEGVGIYPGQDNDLEIKDIIKQYEMAAHYLNKIPKGIKILMCGGNHDATRIAEPQPIVNEKYAAALYDLENLQIVTNPSYITIHKKENFPGFDVLMYHGFSMPFYAENITSIRASGGLDRADLIMKYYLRRRHLAPAHTSTLYIPDDKQDPLVIDKVPDIFVTGHIHFVSTSTYRNISMVNAGCWTAQSEDNARRGIIPNPSKVILINLKTREIKIMDFRDDKND